MAAARLVRFRVRVRRRVRVRVVAARLPVGLVSLQPRSRGILQEEYAQARLVIIKCFYEAHSYVEAITTIQKATIQLVITASV